MLSRRLISAAPLLGSRSLSPSHISFRASSTRIMAAKRVLVPIGTGSEEMEAIITVDVLRRAGAEVTVASVETALEVNCSRGVKIVADKASL